MSTAFLPPTSSIISILNYSILLLFAAILTLIAFLAVLRVLNSRREKARLARIEDIRPLVLELLIGEHDHKEAAFELRHFINSGERRELELVLLDYARFLKGDEMDMLTYVFEDLGFVNEDIQVLQSGRNTKKAESAFHLGRMRSARSVPYLTELLASSNEAVVFQSLDALSHVGTPEAVQTVMDYLMGEHHLKTSRVAEVILEKKVSFAPLIRRQLAEGDTEDWRLGFLIDLAGSMHDTEALSGVLRYLDYPAEQVRSKAARALGTIGDNEACASLSRSLGDSSADVRAEAAVALGQIRCEDSIPLLAGKLGDTVLRVKMSSAVALMKMGPPGRDALNAGLSSSEARERGVVAEVLDTKQVRSGTRETDPA